MKESLSKAKNESDKIESDFEKYKERINTIDATTKTLKEEIKNMQKEKDDDGKLGVLEAKHREIEKEETKCQSELENINSSVKSDQKRKNEISKIISDVSKRERDYWRVLHFFFLKLLQNNDLIKSKEEKLKELTSLNETAQNAFNEAENELKKTQALYEGLCCGLSANEDGTLATLQDQLINVKTKLSDQETTIKQAEIRYSLT